jgi:hypothetical protein
VPGEGGVHTRFHCDNVCAGERLSAARRLGAFTVMQAFRPVVPVPVELLRRPGIPGRISQGILEMAKLLAFCCEIVIAVRSTRNVSAQALDDLNSR